MDEAAAISSVTEWISWRSLVYPTDELVAERFETGWTVYAPVEIDESDPMSFLNMPVGRAVFLVGDSGRIEESSSSVPPGVAEAEFTAQERAMQRFNDGDDDSRSEFVPKFSPAGSERSLAANGLAGLGATVGEGALGLDEDTATPIDASVLMSAIAQELAELGPEGWEQFSAEFAFTVSSEVAQLRFSAEGRTGLVPVPQSVADLVRLEREASAQSLDGPWWRLVLTCANTGETTVGYDYGEEPFPDDQLVDPEHYRDDLETYPRSDISVWLAGYIVGPAAQGRGPREAVAAETTDAAEGRSAMAVSDMRALGDLWARWAVLSAVCVGVGAESGARIVPGYASYENENHSGSTLYMLPGDRAVLSGGVWNSPLLDAAYNGGEPLPDLYTAAPGWVNDSVIDTRNRRGLLTLCMWWTDGRWYRGATDTTGELRMCVPEILSVEDTLQAMVDHTGPGARDQCEALLTSATDLRATRDEVAALFADIPDADVDSAVNQLGLAGVLAT